MDNSAISAIKKCSACEGGVSVLTSQEIQDYLKEVTGWQLAFDEKSIHREYVMKNFLSAIQFLQEIAVLAEKENHHPDLHLTDYRKVKIELSTHAVGGLSQNDFIVAAKINLLSPQLKTPAA